ncbi:MAG: hypothetical protein WCO90_07830 [Planctomycetota bacterium]|jgi:hypothetical protein
MNAGHTTILQSAHNYEEHGTQALHYTPAGQKSIPASASRPT